MRRHGSGWGVGLVLAAVAAGALFFFFARPRKPSGDVWLARTQTRAREARLGYPAADVYRPHSPVRAGASAMLPPPLLQELAALEEAQDFHGLAAAYLLRGNATQAAVYLDKAGHSPDVDCDRALLALDKGDLPEALELLDGVLTASPRHPRALWNRGLVLRELGLGLMAADAFERVASVGEPGWSTEAKQRAEELRRQVEAHQSAYTRALEVGNAMRAGGPVPLEQARAFPGLFRLFFYDALRAAPTRERTLELLPLAQALDTHEGQGTLVALVHHVAGRDFSRRGPLAREHDRLRRERGPPAGWRALIEQSRRAGETDVLMGALFHSQSIPTHLEDYEALAASTGDTWFTLLAAHWRAETVQKRGDRVQAEQLLQAALRTCSTSKLDYRCAELENDLAFVYSVLHRPADARQHALAGLQRARRDHDWVMEMRLLLALGQIAYIARSPPLAEAWFGEALARAPRDCPMVQGIQQNLAVMYQLALRPAEARARLELARACGPLNQLSGVAVLAELARSSTQLDEDAKHFGAALASLRASGTLNPSEQLLLAHYEARFELERDPARGRELLRGNLEDTAKLAREDVNARKARTASYSSLLFDAGGAGDFEAALALFAEEQGMPVPERCSLAVAVDDERTLLVARGPEGGVRGHQDASRTTPFREAEGLVPAPLLEVLRPCERIQVLARPPVQGHAGLLPPELPWSYHVGRAAALHPAPVVARHLVVSDVEPPAALGLPRLKAWAPGEPDVRRGVFSGASATPGRVLAEMADATEIEIHAHGLLNPEVSDASLVVLSPEPDGRYALTAREVRAQTLRGSPVVILAACRAAHTAPFLHESFSLPVAFVEAGARAVFAATVDLPDAEAGPFFESVRGRIRAGAAPSVALRDERQLWLQRSHAPWVRDVLLFE
ncbi:CHAT domain-containing protein [Cystobacter fuscus]|uniref:CHAT domain-containing protein n=1 Tax=Cystobacter fuscus TaxID=43 RepID=UPI002B29D229|nr:CHAT domain-containing protein [Cystobacter fuscus]